MVAVRDVEGGLRLLGHVADQLADRLIAGDGRRRRVHDLVDLEGTEHVQVTPSAHLDSAPPQLDLVDRILA